MNSVIVHYLDFSVKVEYDDYTTVGEVIAQAVQQLGITTDAMYELEIKQHWQWAEEDGGYVIHHPVKLAKFRAYDPDSESMTVFLVKI